MKHRMKQWQVHIYRLKADINLAWQPCSFQNIQWVLTEEFKDCRFKSRSREACHYISGFGYPEIFSEYMRISFWMFVADVF